MVHWAGVVACVLAGCKSRGAVVENPSPMAMPTTRSELLAGTIAVDSAASVTRDSLIVHGHAWGVPEGWTLTATHEHPRIAQVRTPGGLEILVFSFGRGGGTIQANFQRWRDQLQSVQDSSTKLDTVKAVVHAIGRWTGNYRGGNGSDAADGSFQTVVGAVVDGPNGRVFFKVVGERVKVRKEFDRIADWIRSGGNRL
jgi:hypothetical protein